MLKRLAKEHLEGVILPFWKDLKDADFGGYFGLLDYDLELDKKAIKGMILNSRILWFFSTAVRVLGDESLKPYAEHAYDFLKSYGIDKEFGGVYWSLNYDGTCKDDMKHTYNLAFSIYALSAYYEITKEQEVLDLAFEIFDTIEKKCKDKYGYMESFYRDFSVRPNEQLSENGVIADKTMNTLLHVVEAYTQLYKVSKDENVKACLYEQLDYFEKKVYNKEKHRQEVFFDEKWNSILDLHSYGHDIETSWLMDECTHILGDAQKKESIDEITIDLLDHVMELAYKDHSLLNENEDGEDDTTRVWWVQAETVVGFVNAYQKFPERRKYYDAAVDTLQYIFEHMIDGRGGSEWYSEIKEDYTPIKKDIVNPWKCPYHNGRMCLELIERDVIAPCNKKATKEAVTLLQYLEDVRKKGFITGQHTQTKPMEEVEFIFEQTGKYPALCGFELLAYSPNVNRISLDDEARIEVEENRGTLEEALDWGLNKKGIVTFSWHWFSPLQGENKAFYTRNSDFDATKVLEEGTIERKAFYEDMEYMASELQIFKDKKIPILWRPFHESYGTWFWWGAKGNVVARDLYILMYDYFVNTCQLHNLIWVWNSHLAEAYPGDSCVDVVSTDIYREKPTDTDYMEELIELQKNTSVDKPASVAECGSIPDIAQIAANKTDWSYYMVWSKEFVMTEEYASFAKMKEMYASDYAITLDKL